MFKESEYPPQSEYYRLAYVIRANDKLVDHVKGNQADWSKRDEEYIKEPVVIVTEEEQLEGWRRVVKAKVKEAFLRDHAEDYQLEEKIEKEEVYSSQESIDRFFDNYFDIEDASDIHILKTQAWKP